MDSKIEIYQALWRSFFGLRLTIGQALNDGATAGLTFEDAIVLIQVEQHNFISVRDVARTNGRDVASVSRQSTRLELRGWLTKSHHQQDKRLCMLSLTQQAQEVMTSIHEIIERVIEQCVERLTSTERSDLVRMLFIVNDKISSIRREKNPETGKEES
ncbi:MAG: MarR family winged helix-turn-helix transcriptional regulator [Bacteroides sp.]|jgi:hypothetical protein